MKVLCGGKVRVYQPVLLKAKHDRALEEKDNPSRLTNPTASSSEMTLTQAHTRGIDTLPRTHAHFCIGGESAHEATHTHTHRSNNTRTDINRMDGLSLSNRDAMTWKMEPWRRFAKSPFHTSLCVILTFGWKGLGG